LKAGNMLKLSNGMTTTLSWTAINDQQSVVGIDDTSPYSKAVERYDIPRLVAKIATNNPLDAITRFGGYEPPSQKNRQSHVVNLRAIFDEDDRLATKASTNASLPGVQNHATRPPSGNLRYM
jgi:hypothetical protein